MLRFCLGGLAAGLLLLPLQAANFSQDFSLVHQPLGTQASATYSVQEIVAPSGLPQQPVASATYQLEPVFSDEVTASAIECWYLYEN